MKKQKKAKYYVAQVGGNIVYNNPFQQSNAMYTGENDQVLPTLAPRNTPNTGNTGALPTYSITNKRKFLEMNSQANELNPAFLGINALALGASNIGNAVNDINTNKNEVSQYLKAIQPTNYENNERYGLNDLPAYTKFGGKVGKYQVGGAPGQMTTVEDTNPYVKKKAVVPVKGSGVRPTKTAKSVPFTESQGDEYSMAWGRDFPVAGGKVKDAVYGAAKQTGIDPAFLYSSAMQEGMNKAVFKASNVSTAYMNNSDKLNKMSPGMEMGNKFSKQYPVDGFYNYGLDTFGDQYKDLQKKGYLPADFNKRFTTYDAMNDATKKDPKTGKLVPNPQKVNTAAFITDSDALTAKAAMMRNTQDELDAYAKSKKVNLTPKQKQFFVGAAYNHGNFKDIFQSYNDKGYLKNDDFLNDGFKPASYPDVYTHVAPRVRNAERLQKQGLFNDYKTMQTGGEIEQTDGLEGSNKQFGNVEAEQGEAFMDNQGQVGQVSNDAATHEQGGVVLPDVHKVLENTSNIRKDKNSKYLKLEPKQIQGITGLQTNKSMSHAEALVKANENNEELRTKLLKNIQLASKGKKVLDKYAEESTKLNISHFSAIPSKEELFNKLFEHQEFVKNTTGIPSGEDAKTGGWIQKAINPAHKGYCTPMTKSTCTPHRKALAKRFKSGDLHKGQYGIDTSQWLPNPANQPATEPFKGVWRKDENGKMQLYKAPSTTGTVPLYADPNAAPAAVSPVDTSALGTREGRGGTDRLGRESVQREPIPDDGSMEQTNQWTDEQLPQQPATPPSITGRQPLNTGITNTTNLQPQKGSEFNEPLRWYDVASSINAYVAGSERIGEKYNPVQLNQLRYKLQDPTAALNKNTGDFNAAVQAVQNTNGAGAGVQLANIANLTAQKYNFNNQVLGNYENQNAQIKNNEILYNTQVRDKQSIADQQAREVFEEKVLTGKAKQQEQKLTALDSLYKTIAENRALNRNGNLMMKFSTAFDQYGNYNGYQTKFQINPTLGMGTPQAAPTGKGGSNAAGGIQNIQAGKSYYNRKTGKTYYFNGTKMVER